MAKRRKYTETEKAIALEIVDRFEGEINRDCLGAIRGALDAPKLNHSTVYRWLLARGPIANGMQSEKKGVAMQAAQAADLALDEYFEMAARLMLAQAIKPEVIREMKGRELMLSAAIAVDKMQLLRNLPTEIIALLPAFSDALATLGLSPADMMKAIIDEANAKRDYDRYVQ